MSPRYLSESVVDLCHIFAIYVGQALDNLNFAPRVRRKCVKMLYKMCARHALVPGSLHVELPENSVGVVMYRGGFGDVLRREYHGREVAVKALRVYSNSPWQETTNVSHLGASNSLHVLGAKYNLRRGSAKRSLLGNLFGIQMCYRY